MKRFLRWISRALPALLRRLALSFLARPRLPKKSNRRWLLERFNDEGKP